MRVEACGERLWIVRDLLGPAWAMSRWLEGRSVPGVVECVAAYDTVGLHVNPAQFRVEALPNFLSGWVPESVPPTRHTIPVCFDHGLDWETVLRATALTQKDAIEAFCGAEYQCAAIGFCPGFPYLTGLANSLCGLSRLASPRVRVPAGAVGITGSQAGIYPAEVPGGWNILGLTPLVICDPDQGHFPIEPGDLVHFQPVTETEYDELKGQPLCR